MWVPGNQTQVSRFGLKLLYLLSHLTSPQKNVSKKPRLKSRHLRCQKSNHFQLRICGCGWLLVTQDNPSSASLGSSSLCFLSRHLLRVPCSSSPDSPCSLLQIPSQHSVWSWNSKPHPCREGTMLMFSLPFSGQLREGTQLSVVLICQCARMDDGCLEMMPVRPSNYECIYLFENESPRHLYRPSNGSQMPFPSMFGVYV